MRYIFSLTHSTLVTGGVLAAAGYCASWVGQEITMSALDSASGSERNHGFPL